MPKRINITVSDDEYRWLCLWASWHGKSPTTYAGQIIGSRVEANRELIEQLVVDAAQNRGVSVEELISEWNQNE